MTAEQFQDLVSKYQSDIDYKVYQAYPKIKKPAYISVEDLRQDVFLFVFECFQRWYVPEKASPRTFMVRCIDCCLHDIIVKSWKSINSTYMVVFGDDEDSVVQDVADPANLEKSADLVLDLKVFSTEEIEYITLFLTPPPEMVGLPVRTFRSRVRKTKDWTTEEENLLREGIKSKLVRKAV